MTGIFNPHQSDWNRNCIPDQWSLLSYQIRGLEQLYRSSDAVSVWQHYLKVEHSESKNKMHVDPKHEWEKMGAAPISASSHWLCPAVDDSWISQQTVSFSAGLMKFSIYPYDVAFLSVVCMCPWCFALLWPSAVALPTSRLVVRSTLFVFLFLFLRQSLGVHLMSICTMKS